MRLYLRQRVLTTLGLRNYDVYEENGQLLYVVEQQLGFSKELRVYDTENQWVGTVKRKLFRPCKTFMLTQNGKTTEEIRKTGIGERYSFCPRGWVAQGSRFVGDFRIFGEDEAPVAVIDDGCQGCAIELTSREDHLTVLLFAIAVQRKKNSIG